MESEKITSIALPKLATGVGGLSWDVVHPLVTQHMHGAKAHVHIYSTYHKGVKANERS
jgi:O-acetyl-ADP-ribose deacetylase (regulator of RNase III)